MAEKRFMKIIAIFHMVVFIVLAPKMPVVYVENFKQANLETKKNTLDQ